MRTPTLAAMRFDGDPSASIVVLTTPRSGSSWTASLMRSTGLMGVCREWMTWLVHPNAQSRFELPPHGTANGEAFLASLRAASSTPNGVFAVKIISSIWPELPSKLAPWGIGCVEERARAASSDSSDVGVNKDLWVSRVFPRPAVLVLRRRDRIGQAISFWRATATNRFAMLVDDTRPHEMPVYDFTALHDALAAVDAHAIELERAIAAFSAVPGVRMMEAVYEDMLADPVPTVRQLATMAGIKIPETHRFETPLRMQRDDATAEVRARFVADLQTGMNTGTKCGTDTVLSTDRGLIT